MKGRTRKNLCKLNILLFLVVLCMLSLGALIGALTGTHDHMKAEALSMTSSKASPATLAPSLTENVATLPSSVRRTLTILGRPYFGTEEPDTSDSTIQQLTGLGNMDRQEVANFPQYLMTLVTIMLARGLKATWHFVYIDLVVNPHPILIYSLGVLLINLTILYPMLGCIVTLHWNVETAKQLDYICLAVLVHFLASLRLSQGSLLNVPQNARMLHAMRLLYRDSYDNSPVWPFGLAFASFLVMHLVWPVLESYQSHELQYFHVLTLFQMSPVLIAFAYVASGTPFLAGLANLWIGVLAFVAIKTLAAVTGISSLSGLIVWLMDEDSIKGVKRATFIRAKRASLESLLAHFSSSLLLGVIFYAASITTLSLSQLVQKQLPSYPLLAAGLKALPSPLVPALAAFLSYTFPRLSARPLLSLLLRPCYMLAAILGFPSTERVFDSLLRDIVALSIFVLDMHILSHAAHRVYHGLKFKRRWFVKRLWLFAINTLNPEGRMLKWIGSATCLAAVSQYVISGAF